MTMRLLFMEKLNVIFYTEKFRLPVRIGIYLALKYKFSVPNGYIKFKPMYGKELLCIDFS